MAVQFKSYLGEVKAGFEKQAKAALEVIGGKAETYAKQVVPVRTGRLRASITHQVQGSNSVIIGTNVEYAPFVELGVKGRSPKPYIRPAVEEHTQEYKAILEQFMRG